MNSGQQPTRPRFSTFASFGLLAAISIFVIFVPIFIIQMGRPHAMGLTVHVLAPGALTIDDDIQPPVFVRVKLRTSGLEPALYVDSELVSWAELAPIVKGHLKSRHSPIVYLAADEELNWQQVVKVIDIIRGLPAEVVLVTARME